MDKIRVFDNKFEFHTREVPVCNSICEKIDFLIEEVIWE
jgi:hypothetical protein